MKKNAVIITLLFFSTIFEVRSQKLETVNSKEQNSTVSFEIGQKFSGRKKLTSVSSNEVLISFKEKFRDSIITYVNKKLIRKDFVMSDSIELGLSNTAFKIKLNGKGKKNVTLFLPNKNIFVKFNLNKKYRLIKVFNFSEEWSFVYTNYVPIYN